MEVGAQQGRPFLKDENSFITTPDVLRHLNRALQQLDGDSKENGSHDANDDDDSLPAKSTNNGSQRSPACFELQRKLPNGTTRRASQGEQDALAMEQQLQQATSFLLALPTVDDKIEWCERQCHAANKMYRQQQYQQAINAYLLCLSVTSALEENVAGSNTGDDGTLGAAAGSHAQHESNMQVFLFFLRIMNNLAQSTLQLRWCQKTELFVQYALEFMQKYQKYLPQLTISAPPAPFETNQDRMPWALSSDQHRQYLLHISKLYFKRGKARRLRGLYPSSKSDLLLAASYLDSSAFTGKELCDSSPRSLDTHESRPCATVGMSTDAEHRSIAKELSLVVAAVQEAKKNKERQKQGMKAFWHQHDQDERGSPNEDGTSTSPTINGVVQDAEPAPLYDNVNTTSSKSSHSTLRVLAQRPDTSIIAAANTTMASLLNGQQDSPAGTRDGDEGSDCPSLDDYDAVKEAKYHHSHPFSFVRWYWTTVGRVAAAMLKVIGDDEELRDAYIHEEPMSLPNRNDEIIGDRPTRPLQPENNGSEYTAAVESLLKAKKTI
jgi:hypothetical protein